MGQQETTMAAGASGGGALRHTLLLLVVAAVLLAMVAATAAPAFARGPGTGECIKRAMEETQDRQYAAIKCGYYGRG